MRAVLDNCRFKPEISTGHQQPNAGDRMSLPNDVARCMGVGFTEDGVREWREDCEDCLRRTDKGDYLCESIPYITPPAIITFECEFRIEP